MTNSIIAKKVVHFILALASVVTLAVAFMIARPQPVSAEILPPPPPVPANIAVPEGSKLFLVGNAVGTQNYVCLPSTSSSTGVAFNLFTPQATLFNPSDGIQFATHYFSPNPDEAGTVRAAWQNKDSSIVWGLAKQGNSSSDPAYVEPGAIPWLLVTVSGYEDGPTGGNKLAVTTYIQRLNTSGGVAPSGCASAMDIGKKAFVSYTADYYFYR